ncbi:murein biosynthesis integral membrane protein MurJ [Salicola sp. Rm-C-2C1-2]|uniref:murein biosynthesis integral membrane protein MurJ n=1 Tax=Salicola sp. Rm-C-2C1-2 TaxID=3141321 RepID=UPI0032E51E05
MSQEPQSEPVPEEPEEEEASSGHVRGLLRSSGIFAVFTMLSRVLGLARDIVIARYFGAGPDADAFFVAFKIPNFLRRLFGEGAFNQAFVPVLSEYREKYDTRSVHSLVNTVAGSLGFVLLVVSVLAVLGSPWITAAFAPGFIGDEARYPLAVAMLRITFPYLMLISLTAFCSSVLNSYDIFGVQAFTPVILNLSMIASAIWLTPYMQEPILALAWGVVIAGVLQLLFQLPFLARLNLLPRPRIDYRHEGVVQIMKLMAPALFGVSVSQINLLLDTILASMLETGSVSWLYYSDRLSELPLGIFGVAIGTVILPNLSRKHADESMASFSRTLDWALRSVLLLGIPAGLALCLLAEPLIATLFHYGETTTRDVFMSAQSLRAYALALVAFMLVKVLAPGFFSRQDMRTPVRIAVIAMTSNMVFNLILVWPLAHAGLALATALSAWMNASLLLRGLHREGVFRPQPGWGRFALQLLAANALMGVLLLLVSPGAAEWLDFSLFMRMGYTAALVVGGALVYFAVLLLSGVRVRHFRMH